MVWKAVQDWFSRFVADVSKAIRHIAAALLVIFAIGVLVGEKIAATSAGTPQAAFAIIIPLVLAMLAYAFTEVAILIFILFIIGLVIL